MRGLTDAERSTLERWNRHDYRLVVVSPCGAPPPPDHAVELELFKRGLAEWEVDYARRLESAVPTGLGLLALRADAAARAAGVWP